MLRPYTTLRRLALFRPRHHGARPGAGPLDRMIGRGPAVLGEAARAAPGLGDPFAGERAALDLAQQLLHLGFDLVAHDPRAPRVVAVLRRVADRVAHELHPAAVHAIHDELQLVQALEV